MTILRYSKGTNDFFTNQIMDQLFRETKGSLQNSEQRGVSLNPRTNVVDEKERFVIEMLIPGFAKKDVVIKVEDGFLKITGEKEEVEDRTYLRKEFSATKLERTFKLSEGIDQENISAEVRDGILFVNLPKAKVEEPKIKEITIQ
ncbi:Hsp20/alpha crystallin family protein [Labilibaculum euxinus]|uniref:Hsp20 family protein n=1 Tax=Labilibaculum euxinus TaxID=2686357 RepID=A0A7M4D706_9BACT|nr:Hsp20/alpha crystallin family protein [Labilibaculum euxinus]MUP38435.1 Hsp20 family protein [Labilibaculum euxinus]MVB07640.1 Hsp20 family protein [Labilibaculum euxinus]